MDWRLKAGMQGVMSLLPRSSELNRVFQRHVTRSLDVTSEMVESKWSQTRQLVALWSDRRALGGNFSALEIGTGWLPIAPLALRAAGAASVVTLDVENLLAESEVRQTVLLVAEGIENEQLACDRPDFAVELRAALQAAGGPARTLEACGVKAIVGDATSTALPSGSIDLSVSNNTLEHIPSPILSDIFSEMLRLMSPIGASAHFIDLKDHYAGFDRSIGVYNFLAYGHRKWRWYNNSLQYQNRLRASDYRELAKRAGLEIAVELVEREEATALPPKGVATMFDTYDLDDLLVHSQSLLLTSSAD